MPTSTVFVHDESAMPVGAEIGSPQVINGRNSAAQPIGAASACTVLALKVNLRLEKGHMIK
jgi:hypothetical protein